MKASWWHWQEAPTLDQRMKLHTRAAEVPSGTKCPIRMKRRGGWSEEMPTLGRMGSEECRRVPGAEGQDFASDTYSAPRWFAIFFVRPIIVGRVNSLRVSSLSDKRNALSDPEGHRHPSGLYPLFL